MSRAPKQPAYDERPPSKPFGGLLAIIVAITAAAGLGFLVRSSEIFEETITVNSLSPNDAYRVKLIERPGWIDRNFHVILEETESGRERVVFRSPDEGRPIGSERVTWSTDERHFLIVGRHFHVNENAELPGNEQAYLLMDVRSEKIWCNATQQSQYPGFGVGELNQIEWVGWAPIPKPQLSKDEQ